MQSEVKSCLLAIYVDAAPSLSCVRAPFGSVTLAQT